MRAVYSFSEQFRQSGQTLQDTLLRQTVEEVDRLAALLELHPGAALMYVERTAYTTGDRLLHMGENYIRGDMCRFSIDLESAHITALELTHNTQQIVGEGKRKELDREERQPSAEVGYRVVVGVLSYVPFSIFRELNIPPHTHKTAAQEDLWCNGVPAFQCIACIDAACIQLGYPIHRKARHMVQR
jgi:hypothetical protein